MTFNLPYPPSSNRYWRVWRGRAVKSTEARAYQAAVALANRGAVPLTGPVSVDLVVTRPAKRGDLDNFLKVVLDALKGIAFVDDAQIVTIGARRVEGSKTRNGVVVTVDSVATP